MPRPPDLDICRRIARIRLEVAGPRGKAAFAKDLGLSPSTYDYYESTRVPPADVLVGIAERSGADLYWLLTGKGGAGEGVGSPHPLVQRVAKLLADRPDAAAPLAAFLEILAGVAKFPSGVAAEREIAISAGAQAADAVGRGAVTAARHDARAPGQTDQAGETSSPEGWIPILGRSAAGVAQFWKGGDPAGVTMLGDLVQQHCHRPGRQVRPAAVADQGGQDAAVQVIALPAGGGCGPAEFVSASRLKARHGEAFALRIDGDSMAPDIRHGDIVVVSPSIPAADGRAAVVQLAGQIGVTCKLYRRSGDQVHLVSINEQFAPQTFPASKVVWALAVLARVRT